MHFRYITIIILLCTFCSYAHAGDSLFYRHRAKIYLAGQASLIYEYRISRHHGIEASINKAVGTLAFSDYDLITAHRGTILRSAYRYYLRPNSSRRNDSVKVTESDFYLSSMYQYQRLKYDDIEFGQYDVESSDFPMGQYDETRNVHGISIILGHELNFRHLFVDFYAGVGYKLFFRTINYESYFPGTPLVDKCPCAPEKHFGTAEAFHLGIKIGYQFKPIRIPATR